MSKISEETRLHFSETIQPYKDKITAVLEKEKTIRNSMHDEDVGVEYKKLLLCEDMIYAASLYIAQNSLSLQVMEVKNNDALNDARKMLYKAIIYLEEICTNLIDVSYSDLSKYHDKYLNVSIQQRYNLIKKLGLEIRILKDAFGDNSKWKWSFVELEGRFTTVTKNIIDMRQAEKDFLDVRSPNHDITIIYFNLLIKLIGNSANSYRDKYELSTRRIDDMRNGIKYLLALRKLYVVMRNSEQAEEIKKKAVVWKDKMDADHKKGLAN